MLQHLGCVEGLAKTLYDKECAGIPEDPDETASKLPDKGGSLKCEICGHHQDTENLFLRHLSLMHFQDKLMEGLPFRVPYRCPWVECNQEKTSTHLLMLHVGFEHGLTKKLYKEELEKRQEFLLLCVRNTFLLSNCFLGKGRPLRMTERRRRVQMPKTMSRKTPTRPPNQSQSQISRQHSLRSHSPKSHNMRGLHAGTARRPSPASSPTRATCSLYTCIPGCPRRDRTNVRGVPSEGWTVESLWTTS